MLRTVFMIGLFALLGLFALKLAFAVTRPVPGIAEAIPHQAHSAAVKLATLFPDAGFEPDGVIEGIGLVLKDDGVAVIEVPPGIARRFSPPKLSMSPTRRATPRAPAAPSTPARG